MPSMQNDPFQECRAVFEVQMAIPARQASSRQTRLTRRFTLADHETPNRLLLLAVAGSIPFTAREFDPRLIDDRPNSCE